MEPDTYTADVYTVCSPEQYSAMRGRAHHQVEKVTLAGKFIIKFTNGLDLDLLIGDEILTDENGRINAIRTIGGGYYCAREMIDTL